MVETLAPALRGIFPSPIFSISMINLLLISFFIIGFIGGSKSRLKITAAFLLAALYAVSIGRIGFLSQWSVGLAIVMIISTAGSITIDALSSKSEGARQSFKLDLKPLRNLMFFALISLALTFVTYLISGDANAWVFAGKILSSSLTSFGGGEAYIGVAESIFVQTGFIPAEIYFGQIAGVASAMPGPVLVSMATGIGFTYGNETAGIAMGWLFGILGLCLSVAATAFGALTLFTFFELFKSSYRLMMIKEYVMPVVCGILVSVGISLLRQSTAVVSGVGLNPFVAFGAIAALGLFMRFLQAKLRLKDVPLLVFGGAGTLAVLAVVSLYN